MQVAPSEQTVMILLSAVCLKRWNLQDGELPNYANLKYFPVHLQFMILTEPNQLFLPNPFHHCLVDEAECARDLALSIIYPTY
jgi:hypothetical protein